MALACRFIFLGPPPLPRTHPAESWASSRLVMGMGDALHRGLRKGCPWGERDMAKTLQAPPPSLEIGLMKFVGVGGSWLSLGSAIRCQSDPPSPNWSGSHLKSLGDTERWLGLKSPLPRLPWPHSLSPGKMSLGRSPREGRTLKSQRWFWRPSLSRKGEAAQLRCAGDFCDSSQCLHGGTCLLNEDRTPPFYCLCPEGFTGLLCNETEHGPCFPNPCHNDAECQVTDDSHRGDVFIQYICKCPLGYVGIHCETTCTSPLGMQTGAIADSQISASSMHLGFMGLQRWAPELARLHQTGIVNAWTSGNYDKNPWIQVNLMRKMWVTGVVTQGASRAGSAEYLKTFKVAYSTDGRQFQFIQVAGRSGDKIFIGNVNNSGLKINLFDTPLETQYVRLVPIICHRGCTLRFELLGCELNGCTEPLGLKDNTIPNKQITASSYYKTWGLSAFSWFPYYARLDNQGKFNAWTAQTNSASEWLQAGGMVEELRAASVKALGPRLTWAPRSESRASSPRVPETLATFNMWLPTGWPMVMMV
uniref:Milk fat globule EGF and factor V/VIII domain containing n=1 Tax=Bos indicus x Bos taurus TaxID=30522 RepID=A0A4W2GEY5_BOBOX